MFGTTFVINLASTALRHRRGLVASFCLLTSVAAAVLVHSSPGLQWSSPSVITTAIPAAAATNSCLLPGVSVVTDPSGDTGTGSVPTVVGTPAQDITEVLIAEPAQPDGVARIAFTLRVNDLSALPANGMWRVFFTNGATAYFVGAFNDAVAGMQYNYGTSGTITTTLGAADSGSISVADKTITILISTDKVGNPGVGSTLTAIYGRTQTLVGTGTTGGATPTHDLAPNTIPAAGTSNYTLVGSAGCSAATPTPTPTQAGPCSLPGTQVQSEHGRSEETK